MLTPSQNEALSYELVPLFQQLEQDTIKDIQRRLLKAGRWTETAELKAQGMRELGYSPSKIRNEVLKGIRADDSYKRDLAENTIAYKQSVKERIKDVEAQAKKAGNDLVAKAGSMSFKDDLSMWSKHGLKVSDGSYLGRLSKVYAKRLNDSIHTLTRSTGFKLYNMDGAIIRTNKAYDRALDYAVVQMSSGTVSYDEAVQLAVNQLEKSGLRHVDYLSGATRGLDAAVKCAVATTMSQIAGDISMRTTEALGSDLVEVSAHAGARSEGFGPMNHAEWQGKVYSISGAPHEEESARLGYPIEKLSDATGYPDDPLGLCGYNCRHVFYTFIEGVSEPASWETKYTDSDRKNGYDPEYNKAVAKSKTLERQIRQLKRQAIGGEQVAAQLKRKEYQLSGLRSLNGIKGDARNTLVKGYGDDFKTITGADFMSKSMSGLKTNAKVMSYELAKNVDTSVDYAMTAFPQLRGYIKGFYNAPHLDATAAYSKITKSIYARCAVSWDEYKDLATKNYGLGLWSTSDERATIFHEVGHAVEDAYLTDDKYKKIKSLFYETRETVLQGSEYLDIYKSADFLKDTKAFRVRARALGFSYYGLANESEFIAESVSQYLSTTDTSEIANQAIEILFGEV